MNIRHNLSSDDEESDASFDETQEESNGSNIMSDHPQTADSQSSDEEPLEENSPSSPTSPPGGDVMKPLRKGEKKVPTPIEDGQPPNVEMENKMEAPKNLKPVVEMKMANKGTIYSRSLEGIKTLNNRSGSSVAAIVKYLKSTGFEVAVEQRLPKLVLRALKMALVKGEVMQVKRSFKMSPTAIKTSKAVDKMRAKKEKIKLKAKMQEDKAKKQEGKEKKAANEEAAPEKAKIVKKPKMKASERKTNAPAKKKPTAEMMAAAGNAKVAAGIKAEEAFEKSKKPVAAKPAKAAKVAKASEEMPASSKPIAKAKSKASRKSIGALEPTNSQNQKIQVKSITKLVAGKENMDNEENVDSDFAPKESHSTPIASSVPIAPAKGKRKGRVAK